MKINEKTIRFSLVVPGICSEHVYDRRIATVRAMTPKNAIQQAEQEIMQQLDSQSDLLAHRRWYSIRTGGGGLLLGTLVLPSRKRKGTS
jgi:hypothetical protein